MKRSPPQLTEHPAKIIAATVRLDYPICTHDCQARSKAARPYMYGFETGPLIQWFHNGVILRPYSPLGSKRHPIPCANFGSFQCLILSKQHHIACSIHKCPILMRFTMPRHGFKWSTTHQQPGILSLVHILTLQQFLPLTSCQIPGNPLPLTVRHNYDPNDHLWTIVVLHSDGIPGRCTKMTHTRFSCNIPKMHCLGLCILSMNCTQAKYFRWAICHLS